MIRETQKKKVRSLRVRGKRCRGEEIVGHLGNLRNGASVLKAVDWTGGLVLLEKTQGKARQGKGKLG